MRVFIFKKSLIVNLIIFVLVVAYAGMGYYFITGGIEAREASAPIYSGTTVGNGVGLMLNTYGGEDVIPEILDILKKHNAKATFFVGGVWALKNTDVLKLIYESGNEIGNHGFFHKDHDKITNKEQEDEIMNCHKLIKELIGVEMTLFAPPSGAFNKATVEIAQKNGYKTIMWTRDTIDWRDKDSNLVYERATKNIKAGDLILMHPTPHTKDALSSIITTIKSKSLSTNFVSELV